MCGLSVTKGERLRPRSHGTTTLARLLLGCSVFAPASCALDASGTGTVAEAGSSETMPSPFWNPDAGGTTDAPPASPPRDSDAAGAIPGPANTAGASGAASAHEAGGSVGVGPNEGGSPGVGSGDGGLGTPGDKPTGKDQPDPDAGDCAGSHKCQGVTPAD
jgi:hypothetical protein